MIGLPIGNVTSQVFANIYLNELDQFIKHELCLHHYFRYADDFIIVHDDPYYLKYLISVISEFLHTHLSLELHPRKVEVRRLNQGIDFLGYVILPHHIVLRTSTKQRMFRKLSEQDGLVASGSLEPEKFKQSVQSYLGLLTHWDGYDLDRVVRNRFGIK